MAPEIMQQRIFTTPPKPSNLIELHCGRALEFSRIAAANERSSNSFVIWPVGGGARGRGGRQGRRRRT